MRRPWGAVTGALRGSRGSRGVGVGLPGAFALAGSGDPRSRGRVRAGAFADPVPGARFPSQSVPPALRRGEGPSDSPPPGQRRAEGPAAKGCSGLTHVWVGLGAWVK